MMIWRNKPIAAAAEGICGNSLSYSGRSLHVLAIFLLLSACLLLVSCQSWSEREEPRKEAALRGALAISDVVATKGQFCGSAYIITDVRFKKDGNFLYYCRRILEFYRKRTDSWQDVTIGPDQEQCVAVFLMRDVRPVSANDYRAEVREWAREDNCY